MNEQVRLEVAVPGGAEWTVGAGEGLLSCVCPDVSLKQRWSKEGVGAERTSVVVGSAAGSALTRLKIVR